MRVFDVELDKPDEEGYLYDKDCYFGVDIFTDDKDEITFCRAFPGALNTGKGAIRITQNNRLVLECMGEGQETRSFDLPEKTAKRLKSGLSNEDYKTKICFINSGYNALAIRFLRKRSARQSVLIKQERN